jgi:signal transduction histidine kinase
MRFPAPTLRRTITVAIVTVALLAVVAASALVALTTFLHNASVRSTSAVESVRLAEEVQRDILLHDRVSDPTVRAQIASGLRDRLARARRRVSSPEQGDALASADRAVSDYLTADDAPTRSAADVSTRHAAAFGALEALVAMNLDDARHAYATVERYDRLADVIGIGVAATVTAAAGAVLWWLNARALRPLFGLARTMKRFGRGDVDERADEDHGPAELAEMARRFNEMATSIARQRSQRQSLVAGVAHDLRNPLAVLRMSTDVIASDGAPLEPAKAAKVFAAVRRQVERLERMVGDLLDSATVEAGNVRLHIESHDVRSIARDVVEHYAKTTSAHTVTLEAPDAQVTIPCDDMRIEQVLSNLVSNAIKYSPRGGRVTLALTVLDDEVVFRVSDEGIGMSEEDAATVFEPFRRSGSLRDQVAGSGLGLFVVRRLVEAHGGSVDVQTQPGDGSTFEVRLPRAPEQRSAPQPNGDAAAAGAPHHPS